MSDQPATGQSTKTTMRLLASTGLVLSVVQMVWGIGSSVLGNPGGALLIGLGAAQFVAIGLIIPFAIHRGRF